MALEQDSLNEADSISAGGVAPEGEPWDEQAEQRRHEVPAGLHGWRLDRALAALVPEFSRSYLQQLLADGGVLWRERACTKAATRVSAGDTVVVTLRPTPQARAFVAEPMALDLVFEDEHLLVIDKPAGLVVHPAAGHWGGTLLNGLLAHHAGAAALPRAGIVHRLDRDTSGLLVVARTEQAMSALAAQLADRSMGRRYLALADGRCPAHGCIDAAIARDEASRVRMAAVPAGRGRAARTWFRTLARGRIGEREVSLIECRLDSGRTHQIRVHLRSLGHPLVGDTLYGGPVLAGFARQALHAWQLRLRHPADGRAAGWSSPMPADMVELCAAAGIDAEAAQRAAAAPFEPQESR